PYEAAQRPLAGHPHVDVDRLPDVVAFNGLIDPVIVDPSVPMTGKLPTSLHHGCYRFGIPLQRHGHRVDGYRDLALGEELVQPPEAHSWTELVLRLDRKVPCALPRHCKAELGQKRLR